MRLLWCTLLFLLLTPLPVGAQDPPPIPELPSDPEGQARSQIAFLYKFELEGPDGRIDVPPLGSVQVPIIFRDLSSDTPTSLSGQGDTPVFSHRVEWIVEPISANNQGWTYLAPPSFMSNAGQEYPLFLTINSGAQVINPYFELNLTARVTTEGGTFNNTIKITAVNFGIPGFTANALGGVQIGPREVDSINIRVFNTATLRRSFQFELIDNPCALSVVAPNTVVVPERDERIVSVTLQGPDDKFWYNYDSCTVMFSVWATENPSTKLTAPVSVDVNGFYVAPEWIIWTLTIAIVVTLIVLFLKDRKERVEEEILGKPQKPWTIPVEEVYLKHLKRKDRRAWYVVRHFLMEEEHRSALLWYNHYKQATKGQRTKERIVVQQEHAYERWQAKWLKRLEAPMEDVRKLERKLQKKLDRIARKKHRKALRQHKGLVRKMKKGHAKREAKAMEKWEKARAKAEKKNRPVPPQPSIAAPAYPDEPKLQAVNLEDHKWSKRVEKARKKAVRTRGDLDVKFEKEDAKHLLKVQRKVRKIAKKIDDPEFIAEHPLLSQ